MTIGKLLSKYSKKTSPLDLEILLSLATKRTRECLFTHPDYKLSPEEHIKLRSFIKRRQNSEPIAYITGKKEFFGLEFEVSRSVLIPRPETELLVEQGLKSMQNAKYNMPYTFIDVGTGCGNIIISIYKHLPQKIANNADFIALERSEKALKVAKKNADKHKVKKNIRFINSDLLEAVLKNKTIAASRRLIILANLPYLNLKEYKKCAPDIRNYEPKDSLISGNHGLSHYEKLFHQIKDIISSAKQKKHIVLLLEIEPSQRHRLCDMTKKLLPQARAKFFKDLSKKTRVYKIDVRVS